MAQDADYFGTQMVGFNPWAQQSTQQLSNLAGISQMMQGWASIMNDRQQGGKATITGARQPANATQPAYTTNAAPTPGRHAMAAADPGGGDSGGGSGNGPYGTADPGPPPTNCQFGATLRWNGLSPYWSCNPDPSAGNETPLDPGGPPPNRPPGSPSPNNPGQPGGPPGTPPYTGQTPPFPGGGGGGGSSTGVAPNFYSGNLPPELAGLRYNLGNFLNSNLSRQFPMYPGNLQVPESPYAAYAGQMASLYPGMVSGGAQDAIAQILAGNAQYQAPRTGMPDISQLLAGTTPDAANMLMQLAQQGAGNTGQYLGFGEGIINAALQNNPFLTQNLGRAGTANNMFQGAYNLGTNSVGGYETSGISHYLQPGISSFQNLMNTGNAPNIQAALDAIQQRSNLQIEDDLAQIREQYGNRGLGASSDAISALAQGASRGRADMNAQMTALQADVMNQASNRMLGAQQLAPGLAQAYNQPYENYLARMAQGSSLANQAGAGMTGLLGTANAAGTGMQDSLTNMANTLGQYGNITANATQAGTNALIGAGNLQAGSYDRMLGAAQLASQFSLGQGQLANQAAGVRNDAMGQIGPLLNAITGAGTMGTSGLLGAANYYGQIGTGNIERPWQAWQQSQQFPILNSAISFMTGSQQPQMPVIPSSGSNWGQGMMGMAASILPALIMASSKRWKDVLGEIDDAAVLELFKQIEVYQWKYKSGYGADLDKHVGMLAEDFRDTFKLGNGTHINVIDAIGLLFSAVKQLAKQMEVVLAPVN